LSHHEHAGFVVILRSVLCEKVCFPNFMVILTSRRHNHRFHSIHPAKHK
jgi:hypothetical protein